MGGKKLWYLHKEITGAYCYHKTMRYERNTQERNGLFMKEKHLTIASVKAAYQSGEKTPTGLMQEIIEKAKKYSNKNIWIIAPDMERIRPYIEKLGEMDFDKKPLWGIPFAIKDNIDLAGTPTTAGCKAYTYVPEESATVVDRLIKAGAIPIGKTNLDQFATGLVGTRSPYGEVSNALKPELISGGSSSGSAVSVALGMACFSLGTDTAGSGRVPAALNHLTGFKPTCGAWPLKGVVPACASLDCVTVFADSVEEAMKVDEVVRGLDESDRWSKEVSRKEDKLPECIYLPEQEPEFYGPYDVQYKAAWDKTISFLEQTGCKVRLPWRPPRAHRRGPEGSLPRLRRHGVQPRGGPLRHGGRRALPLRPCARGRRGRARRACGRAVGLRAAPGQHRAHRDRRRRRLAHGSRRPRRRGHHRPPPRLPRWR